MTTIAQEMARSTRNRARRQRSTTVVFQKLHKGLYMSHEHGMTLSHEPVWFQDVGRKWELSFQLSHMGLMAPSKHSKKFDTIQEARAYANALVRHNNKKEHR
jgi:hypothetical protein